MFAFDNIPCGESSDAQVKHKKIAKLRNWRLGTFTQWIGRPAPYLKLRQQLHREKRVEEVL